MMRDQKIETISIREKPEVNVGYYEQLGEPGSIAWYSGFCCVNAQYPSYGVMWRTNILDQPSEISLAAPYHVGLAIGSRSAISNPLRIISNVRVLGSIMRATYNDPESKVEGLCNLGTFIGEEISNINIAKNVLFIPVIENFKIALNDISSYFLLRDPNAGVISTGLLSFWFEEPDLICAQQTPLQSSISKKLQAIVFDPEILESADIRPSIEKVVEIALVAGDRFGVSIRRARIHRFTSREVPGYTELVITFFTDANRNKIIEFFSPLAECIGAWRQSQTEVGAKQLADQVSIEILPLEFWENVRPRSVLAVR